MSILLEARRGPRVKQTVKVEFRPTSFATGDALSSLSYINASSTCLNSSYASLNTMTTIRIELWDNNNNNKKKKQKKAERVQFVDSDTG